MARWTRRSVRSSGTSNHRAVERRRLELDGVFLAELSECLEVLQERAFLLLGELGPVSVSGVAVAGQRDVERCAGALRLRAVGHKTNPCGIVHVVAPPEFLRSAGRGL